MPIPSSRTPERGAEILATLLLSGLGVASGSFLGALYLIRLPETPFWPLWSALCVALILAPAAAAFVAVSRLLAGRGAIWIPLFGILAIVVVMFAIVLLGLDLHPPLDDLSGE